MRLWAIGLVSGILPFAANCQVVRPVAIDSLPQSYESYSAGPIRLRFDTLSSGQRGAGVYFRFALIGDTTGARIDAATGVFEWQPLYVHEGQTHSFRIGVLCEECTPGPEAVVRIQVGAIRTEPQLRSPRLLSLQPNQRRTIDLEVMEPSGQPVAVQAVSSSLPSVVVNRNSEPLRISVQTSSSASGTGRLQVVLRNEADGVLQEVEIPLTIEAEQYAPRFLSNQTVYRVPEGESLIIESPAADRNLDPLYYDWEEMEGLASGATFSLTDPQKGTYKFQANDLGDADLRVATYKIRVSDGFETDEKVITVEVRRAISHATEKLRREIYQQLVQDYAGLVDSCQATLRATQRMVQKRNLFNRGVDIGLFGITLAGALATNLANPATDLPKVSSILGAVGAGLVALIKVNLSTELALQSTTQGLQTELITAQKRLEILYGGDRLGAFVLSGTYTAVMDEYRIGLESARTRYRLSLDGALQSHRITRVLAWRNEYLLRTP